MLKEEVIDSMVFNIMLEIAEQYSDIDALDLEPEALASFIKEDLGLGSKGLEEAMDEVWENALDNVCYGDEEYWRQEYQTLASGIEMIANEERESILLQLKEVCLA